MERLSTAEVNAIIPDASIEPKKIKLTFKPNENLQSDNYVAGVSGWILRGDGTYEFN